MSIALVCSGIAVFTALLLLTEHVDGYAAVCSSYAVECCCAAEHSYAAECCCALECSCVYVSWSSSSCVVGTSAAEAETGPESHDH